MTQELSRRGALRILVNQAQARVVLLTSRTKKRSEGVIVHTCCRHRQRASVPYPYPCPCTMFIVPPPSSQRRRMSKPRARDSESHVPTSNTARLLCGFVSIWELEPGLPRSFPASPDPHHFRRTVPRSLHGFAYTRLSLSLSRFRPSFSVVAFSSFPYRPFFTASTLGPAAGSLFFSLSFLLEPVHPSRVGGRGELGVNVSMPIPQPCLVSLVRGGLISSRGRVFREAIVRLPIPPTWDGGSE